MRKFLNDDLQKLEEWHKTHKESSYANYSATVPAMEAEGAKRIFSRSIANRNICYTSYYGDGDTKAYEAVKFIYDTKKNGSQI